MIIPYKSRDYVEEAKDNRVYETQDKNERKREVRRLKKRINIKIEETEEMAGYACNTWSYWRV